MLIKKNKMRITSLLSTVMNKGSLILLNASNLIANIIIGSSFILKAFFHKQSSCRLVSRYS